jgi:protein gp37
MANETLIAWTDHTANFWMGCMKVSAGCKHCYAETLTRNRMGLDVWGPPATTERQPVKSVYGNVRKWERMATAGEPGVLGPAKPHLVFIGSLMDWAEDHPALDEIRAGIWPLIRESPHLHFQMLTKRPERIQELLPDDWGAGYPNVWLGTSIEDMRVVERADYLRSIPAVVRFISYEPALGPLDALDLGGIDWVIYGGESGPGFRPHDLAWPRAMRDKCRDAGVSFFYKQSAAFHTERGIELDGEIVREFPEPRSPNGQPKGLGRMTSTALTKPWQKDLPPPVIKLAKQKAVEATAAWNSTITGILTAAKAVHEVKEKIGGAPSGSFIAWGKDELKRSSFMVSALATIGARHSLLSTYKNALPPSWSALYELAKAPDDLLRRVLPRLRSDMERNDVTYLLLEETAEAPPKKPAVQKTGTPKKDKQALSAPREPPQPGPREAANATIMAGSVLRTVKDFAARVDTALNSRALAPEAKSFIVNNYLVPSREKITAIEKLLTDKEA